MKKQKNERTVASHIPRFQSGRWENIITIQKHPYKYRAFITRANGEWLGTFPSLKEASRSAIPCFFALHPAALSERTYVVYLKP